MHYKIENFPYAKPLAYEKIDLKKGEQYLYLNILLLIPD